MDALHVWVDWQLAIDKHRVCIPDIILNERLELLAVGAHVGHDALAHRHVAPVAALQAPLAL